MTRSLLWISGASNGIGAALAATVPWEEARIIGISRSRPADGIEHLEADLADPSSWPAVGESFRRELEGFQGDHAVFVQAAGTIDPIGFAGEVDDEAYRTNVLINSAAPQVLGHLFLSAAREVKADRAMVMLTSGAARTVYPGWASYGAAKAATDQWVRDVGAEQTRRGGVRVVSIAPGTVDTDMQAFIRKASEDDFPNRQKFVDLHEDGKLTPPEEVARNIWSLVEGDLENGSVLDLRELAKK
ncbi:MAG TPA: SDR family NAD(P)-dependent oxidoreductase [Acidimicrobiales bacterium]